MGEFQRIRPFKHADKSEPWSSWGCAMLGFICMSLTSMGITSIPHLVSQAAMKTAVSRDGYEEAEILAVVMVTIAVVLTVASLAGQDWVRTSYYEGKVQSWGLWWDCFRVHSSFEMCVSKGWLMACASMVFLSLISNVVATILGVWGLCAKRRLPYVLAGVFCIISGVCQLMSVILYPIMFTYEIRNNADNNAETSNFAFAWTYGIACGTIFFVIGASIFFLIRLRDEDDAQRMKSSHEKPTFYTS